MAAVGGENAYGDSVKRRFVCLLYEIIDVETLAMLFGDAEMLTGTLPHFAARARLW